MSHVQNQHQEAAVILLCNQPCCGQTTEGVMDFNNELIITLKKKRSVQNMFCFLHVQFLKVDLMEAVKMLLGLSTEPSFHLDMKTRNEKQLR